jgi:hypothetical protein
MKTKKQICLGLLTIALCLLSFSPAGAQFSQQGSKLVGADAVGAKEGISVSLSADGNTAIVGGYADNSNAGGAFVYTRSGGVWTQQGSKLVGTGAVGAAIQGWSVAISADGNTAIVGGCFDNSNAGAAWVYTRSGGAWTQQGSKLVGTGAVGSSRQGSSVAISSDGNTVIVGGEYDNSSAGAAWVFTRTAGIWTQQGSKFVGTGAVGSARQGVSVSLSADGNTAIVGGFNDNSNTGAAWAYTRSGGIWTQQGSKLVGTGAVGSARQGISVSLSSDGNTAIVGGQYDNTSTGAAWVFTRSGGTWTQQGSKLVGTGAVGSAQQGRSVSLSGDGLTAFVGGFADNSNAGAAWVYLQSGGSWSQQGSKLVGTGAVGSAQQGTSVSISADGSTAIVGGVGDNGYRGAAWVYVPCTLGIDSIRTLTMNLCDTTGSCVTLSPDGTTTPPQSGIEVTGAFMIVPCDTADVTLSFILPNLLIGTSSGTIPATFTSNLAGWSTTGFSGPLITFNPQMPTSLSLVPGQPVYVVLGMTICLPTGTRPDSYTGSAIMDISYDGSAASNSYSEVSAITNLSGIQGELPITVNVVDCNCIPVDSIAINTGWDQSAQTTLAVGAWDFDWYIISDPFPATHEPRPARVIDRHPAWKPAETNSQWISSRDTYIAGCEPAGNIYVFESYFCLFDSINASLSFWIRVDDTAKVYLNGHFIRSIGPGSFSGSAVHVSTTNSGFFKSGKNTIRVVVNNYNCTAMGLDVAGTVYGNMQGFLCCCSDSNGVIMGIKWNDLDGDGQRDAGEPPLNSWPIHLTNEMMLTTTTTTDEFGNYFFMFLPDGDYTLTEEPRTGWLPTYPPSGNYPLSLNGCQDYRFLDFGNRVDTIIRGASYNKDFKNTTGDTVNNIEIVLQGHQDIVWHYDNQIRGDSIYADGLFCFSSELSTIGGHLVTILTWDSLTVLPGQVVHIGFQTRADKATIQNMYWTKDSVCVGLVTQVNIYPSSVGVGVANNLLDCNQQPINRNYDCRAVGIEFHWQPVPLPHLNGYTDRHPLSEYSISTEPISLMPGASDTLEFPVAPPAEAQYVVWIIEIDTISGMSSPAKVYDYVQFPILKTIDIQMANGWNIVSAPSYAEDMRKSTLFPSAISSAFGYNGSSYQIIDTLLPGKGYWVKFGLPQFISVRGYEFTSGTVDVDEGWNMIGSLSVPIPVSGITSDPPGITTSQFFGFDDGYRGYDTLIPGKGFWIKVTNTGTITLSADVPPGKLAKSAIKIIHTNELPPPPPDGSVLNEVGIPKEYALGQAYPNPFNPSTVIKYELPMQSHVTLSVYNTIGQRVALLIDDQQDAGYREVTFNANELSSGVYFYRLQAGSFVDTKKLLLLK